MLKKILAIIAGIIVAMITVKICESFSHMIYPPPEGLEGADLETMSRLYSEHIKTLPIGAFISLWAGWMISAFVGAFVSSKISPTNWKINSYFVASTLLLFSIIMMFLIPHPIWMIVITVLGYLPSAYLGSKLAAGK